MNTLYKETMEQIKMSDKCSKKIEVELLNLAVTNNSGKYYKNRFMQKSTVAALLIIVFGIVSVTGIIAYASDGKVMSFVYSFFSGGGITYEEGDSGESKSSVIIDSEPQSPVELIEGRLYYTADGNQRDITDKISDKIPFIWEMKDKENNIHKFIIGGKAMEDCYGYVENIFNADGTYIGGTGWFGNKIPYGDEEKPEWLLNGEALLGIK